MIDYLNIKFEKKYGILPALESASCWSYIFWHECNFLETTESSKKKGEFYYNHAITS